ncbi:TPA: hypothetical protein RG718_000414 [Providencia rettgeri]|nr:hypothetical protein [Providencia rettgeri]HEF8779545.1 hypothetical protein [Providencia rettgeri]
MEFKGTPAPWFIEEYDINGKCNAKYFDIRSMSTDGYEYMDLLDSVRVGDEKALANAYLIAAAPELLSELIRLRNIVASYKQDSGDNLDITDAVIAKALGQQ